MGNALAHVDVVEHDIACPACGRLIVEPTPKVIPERGDGSVWVEQEEYTPLPMDIVRQQLAYAEQRVSFNPKDADALQTLWCWQAIMHARRFSHRRTR